ncbi:MAG: methyltransferase domain-containing protein [Acidobacteriia bacterium]|nr:methyltransferase domain-containing protein [Methyloceanibacter sp.]MCL6491740.1 methyltransferase domain-containing protein [Terriglobia bacterium]
MPKTYEAEESGRRSMPNLGVVRLAYARQIMAAANVADPALAKAIAAVPREKFLPEDEPWTIARPMGEAHRLPENDPVFIYQDVEVGLRPERGLFNGSPTLHAALLHALSPQPGDHILHIGAGTGYYTAILAELVGASGRVTAIERDPELAAAAQKCLAPWANVTVVCGDGADWPHEDVSRIYVNCTVLYPAPRWLDRLSEGGRLVFPFGYSKAGGPGAARRAERAGVLLVERRTGGFAARFLGMAHFDCAEGVLAEDEATRLALLRAFTRGGVEHIGSLLLSPAPDTPRLWLYAPRWGLSYDPPPEAG